MSKKKTFDGVIVKTEVDEAGYSYAYDKNDRSCWGSKEPQRVVLVNDLRKYAAGLHVGQLGWTIPGTTDGYKWIDVRFDNGATLPILTYGIERVVPEKAADLSLALIAQNRGTRFDADPVVAARSHAEWIQESFAPFVATDQLVELGTGHQELYAFTFPSLQALAALKDESHYPVKIGYTGDQDAGSLARIRSQVFEAAAFPERPSVLLVCRTWSGRKLETAVHARLREQGRRITTAPGREWFMTNPHELVGICEEFRSTVPLRPRKPVSGASPTLEEALDGNAIELIKYPGSACVGLRIRPKKPDEDGAE